MKKIIRLFIFLLILFSFSDMVYAERIVAVDCEYTNQYVAWLRLSDEEKAQVVVPPKCKTEGAFYTNSYANVKLSSVGDASAETFSLINQGYDTGQTYQGNFNTCWAFSTLAGVESNLLVNGIKRNGSEMYKFSPAHLELTTQDSLFTTALPIHREYDVGGNPLMAAAYFFGRFGPVLEEDVPYSLITDNISNNGTQIKKSDLGDGKAVVSVNDLVLNNNSVGACSGAAIRSIKEYLVTNGGLVASMYYNSRYYSSDYNYYYYNDSDPSVFTNHGITIIGWNDNVPASYFRDTPPGNGAWFVKNSNHSQAGYHYISYYDTRICTMLSGFYNVSEDVDDNVYVYDELGPDTELQFGMDIYFANKFSRKGTSNKEKLKKITFFISTIGQKYDVLVSRSGLFNDKEEILSGGIADRVGYITVDVSDRNIELTSDNFAVIVKYYNNVDNALVPLFVEDTNEEMWYSKLSVQQNRTYISKDEINWGNVVRDVETGEAMYVYATVKAYTDDVVEGTKTFTASFYKTDGVSAIGKTSATCTTTGTSCTITLPTITPNTNYQSLGWFTSAAAVSPVGQPGGTYTLTGNTKLYAKAESQVTTYSASLVIDDGINPLQNDTLSCTTAVGSNKCNVTLPTLSLKNGYELVGWYNAQTGGTRVDENGNTIELSANVTLYARSQQVATQYTVTFNKDSGTSAIGKSSSACTVANGNTTCVVKLPTITAKSGYNVLGWYDSATGGNKVGDANSDYTVSGNITLYARTQFVPKTYTVTFDKETGVSAVGKTSESCTTENGNTTCVISLPTITVSENYTALGWYTANGNSPVGQPNSNYTVSGNITLYARASLNVTGYTATFEATDGVKTIQTSSSSCTFENGSTSCKITLPTITANTSYQVLGWYDSETGGNKVGDAGSEYTLVHNITLYARASFVPKTYTVTFNKTDGVSAIGKNSLSCTTENGSTTCKITLPTITANDGYQVLGWYDNATGGNKVGDVGSEYTVSSNKTLYARVKNNNPTNSFVVSFNSSNDNITISESTLTCTTQATSCKITLPEITAPNGYFVLGWYDSETGGNKIGDAGDKYTVTGDVTLYPRIMADPDNDPSVTGDTEIVIEKNPNNPEIEENVDNNPGTGGGAKIFVLVLLMLSLLFAFYYNRYKKNIYSV